MNLLLLIVWFAVCAVQDARQRKISNWLTFGAVALALGYLLITGHTWLGADAQAGGWALLLSLILTLPGYLTGKLGAADVKLLAALALATDSRFLLGTVIGAGVTMLIWLLIRQKLITYMNQLFSVLYPHANINSSNRHPYAPYLFAGFLLTVLCTG
jgi:prepilin peptidase CpaA